MTQHEPNAAGKSRSGDRDEMATDCAEIISMLGRYCHALDRGDIGSIVELFVDDCVLTVSTTEPQEFRTKAQLRDYFDPHEVAVRKSLTDVRHSVALPDVAIEGDRATVCAYFDATAIQVNDGAPLVVAGRYDDELRRTPEGWRFVSRAISVLYSYSPTCASAPRRLKAAT